MKKLIVVMAIIALSATASMAKSTTEGDLIIYGSVALTIRAEAGGLSIEKRVAEVTTRVNDLLSDSSFESKNLAVKEEKGQYTVVYKERVIVTVDQKTAELEKKSPKQLAETWVKDLQSLIAAGKVTDENTLSK